VSVKTARLCISLAVAFGALASIGVSPASVAARGVQNASIASAIGTFKDRLHIPALSVALVVNGELRFAGAYGIADVENGVAATPATVFRIASASKPLAAVAAMQLAERGVLDLDAPVQKYAPAFPVKRFPITTRQVLAHVSGIRNYRPGEGERTTRYGSLTDALSIFKDDDLDHEPGLRFTYTTFGYTLLGVIIEGASGQSFDDYMREQVFTPAGMSRTVADDVLAIVPNRARGYTPQVFGAFDGNYRNAILMDSSYKRPAGGWLSTAEDLARFAMAVESGRLIKPETFRKMTQGQRTTGGVETGYAYGWYVNTREGGRRNGSVWHGGVQPGFTSDLWLIPSQRFAVAIVANLEGGGRLGLADLGEQIAAIMLGPASQR
jgi:serine beta-lactamase-like protein LACTB, mitochondrial